MINLGSGEPGNQGIRLSSRSAIIRCLKFMHMNPAQQLWIIITLAGFVCANT
jgi:hypothetical protein